MTNSSISIIEPQPPLPNFELNDLNESLKKTCMELGWDDLTLVQKKAIPYILNATDLITQSKTGSGKTGAFLLPLLQVMEVEHVYPQALILLPTRELALQVAEQFEILAKYTNFKCIAIYGGKNHEEQVKKIQEGVHLIVGTAGRILDHLRQKTLDFSGVRDLVMDEADEMLSMGFYPDMLQIKQFLPNKRCSYMFSATIPQVVLSLAREFLNNYKILNLCTSSLTIPKMDYTYYLANPMEKDKLLCNILQYKNPNSAIIFCNTKKEVQYLFDYLKDRNFPVGMISGDVPQKNREKVIVDIKNRSVRFLIATDIAARGIDIKNLSYVIHYNHPLEAETYIHRSGRTARANQKGTSLSLVSELEEIQLQQVREQYKLKIELQEHPTEKDLNNNQKNKLIALLEDLYSKTPILQKKQAISLELIVQEISQDKKHNKLISNLLHQFYLSPETMVKLNEHKN